mgnify:CR=1 FL=1
MDFSCQFLTFILSYKYDKILFFIERQAQCHHRTPAQSALDVHRAVEGGHDGVHQRQTYLLTRMGEHQTIVTTCDTAAFARTNGKIVMVKGGVVEEA